MPQTYDGDDCRLELAAELTRALDDLKIESEAHKRTADSLNWYRRRVDMLQREQSRMRDPERTIVCDIIANCALLPDPGGSRYGTPNNKDKDEKPTTGLTREDYLLAKKAEDLVDAWPGPDDILQMRGKDTRAEWEAWVKTMPMSMWTKQAQEFFLSMPCVPKE